MNRKPFTPQPGTGYRNQGGGIFDCIASTDESDVFIMRNRASGWTFNAHGVGIYDDDSIDWNYSTDGHFESVSGQQTPPCQQDVFRNAVQTWGKEAQTDMMIEEMAELTKEILNERRGRDHNIAEEMADVKIMLAQMEIMFQNAEEVGRIFWKKIARLDQRLNNRKDEIKKIKVLSLFDGISCGMIALERAGLQIERYAAYEIDNFAIQVSEKNYPQIERYGDVTQADFSQFQGFDLVIGGSPCQGFSFAGKQLNFDDPRSKLFFEFERAVKEIKPKYFLLENVKMKKEYQDIISECLGVQPIEINSSLVSAQNRERLYWTNIPGIQQPKNKNITIYDILEDCGTGEQIVINKARNDKARCIRATSFKDGMRDFIATNIDRKTCVAIRQDSPGQGTYKIEGGKVEYNGKKFNIELEDGYYKFRKLTPVEFERLQTIPDNYTDGVSKTQRYKTTGNGWTVDVIAHILRHAQF